MQFQGFTKGGVRVDKFYSATGPMGLGLKGYFYINIERNEVLMHFCPVSKIVKKKVETLY